MTSLVQVASYVHLLSGPLRPSVWGAVFSCSTETIRRCRTIVVDEEEREQKVCLTLAPLAQLRPQDASSGRWGVD